MKQKRQSNRKGCTRWNLHKFARCGKGDTASYSPYTVHLGGDNVTHLGNGATMKMACL